MGRLKVFIDLKHDIWTYLVLLSVKRKYCNYPCRKNEIFACMVTSLINIKVEFVPRCLEAKHDICTYLVLNSVNKRYWDCLENKILDYMVGNLINGNVEYVLWFKTYMNLFGFVIGKTKVLEWRLSRKWDFSLFGYKIS